MEAGLASLKEQILSRIAASGSITVAEYMEVCALDPEHGYYCREDPVGRAGAFTTSPEISQMFGELVGMCLAQSWIDQSGPEEFVLAELGPGRGTLMADLLRATATVNGFHAAARILLVEASPSMRRAQKETLDRFEVGWAADLSNLPRLPLFLVANEFFDALPIRQFVRTGTGWQERLVTARGDRLEFTHSVVVEPEFLPARLADTRPGDIVETCDAATPIVRRIADSVGSFGGMALIIDYGDTVSLGDTLQGVRNHARHDVLEDPGEADLSAHVDFLALRRHAPELAASPLIGQGEFLERLGITPRAHNLARQMQGEALESHIAAHRRLTHPEEMGSLFKVMALYPEAAPAPPGFG